MLQPLRYVLFALLADWVSTKVEGERPLGGYERLLSRKTPGTSYLSLSHGSAFVLSSSVRAESLERAVAHCMAKHPLLRSRIVDGDEGKGRAKFAYCQEQDLQQLARSVLRSVRVQDAASFGDAWKRELERGLNRASMPEGGPLWSLTHVSSDGGALDSSSALVFCVNHGIDDQQSLNIVVRDLVEFIARNPQQAQVQAQVQQMSFPPSVEEAVAPEPPSFRTAAWAVFQLCNSIRGPAMVPRTMKDEVRAAAKDPDNRSTYVQLLTLPEGITAALRKKCSERGVTITSLLSAAMLCVTSAVIEGEGGSGALLRFLLSVDLRRFGAGQQGRNSDWAQGTVACAAGAVDFLVPVSASVVNRGLGGAASTQSVNDELWKLAEVCKQRADFIINDQQWAQESVRLFGLGMQYADILKVVELDAASGGLGRGYSCGVSNMGAVSFGPGESGGPSVTQAFYGTSHSRNGVLCQLSCMTVAAKFCGCLQFTDPIIPPAQGARIRDILTQLLSELAKE